MTEQIKLLSNKFFAVILAGIVTTLFGTVIVLFYLGFFTRVEVHLEQSPEYRIAYLLHTGPYNQIEPTIKVVAERLQQSKVEALTPVALLLDDNGRVKPENRRSKVGYLLATEHPLPENLQQELLPGRQVLRVRFSGGTLLGSYKAYKAMRQWAKANDYQLQLPALEIYHPDQPTEYQLGVSRQN